MSGYLTVTSVMKKETRDWGFRQHSGQNRFVKLMIEVLVPEEQANAVIDALHHGINGPNLRIDCSCQECFKNRVVCEVMES